jgi:hypothetical protein
MQRSARAGPAIATLLATSVACGEARTPLPDARGPVGEGLAGRATPACPRDAALDGTGRCACVEGALAVLGACVPPATGDAYCGPAARLGAEGCAFKRCDRRQTLDVATGLCEDGWPGTSARAPLACSEGASPVLENGTRVCAPPDAACPRGTRRSGGVCLRGPGCPAGSLPEGEGCRAVVLASVKGGGTDSAHKRVVDVGAWAALAIGVDGGPGSGDACRPLEQEVRLFEAPTSAAGPPLELRIALTFPDQDVSRMIAEVEARDAMGQRLHGESARAVETAVDTMTEALRSLGGESNAASVHLAVHCPLGAKPQTADAGPKPARNTTANHTDDDAPDDASAPSD